MSKAHTVRRQYLDTADGQLHITTCGEGLPVILMHWVPLSGRLYDEELVPLAARGYRAIAVDLMGFGRSSPRPEVWPVERHAACVAEGLKAIGVGRCGVVGAHFSAPVAVEMIASGAVDAAALVLDGVGAFLPPEAGAKIFAKVGKTAGPGLHPDGAHETFLWHQAVNTLSIFDPDFAVNEETLPRIYRFILDYLSTGLPKDFGSNVPYAMAERLGGIGIPTCVITAETDPLRDAQGPTLEHVRNGRAVTMPGAHPLHHPARAGEYANALADFFDAAIKDTE